MKEPLTPEQIAEDFCTANPGKTAIVHVGSTTVIRDPSGNVRKTETVAVDPEEGVDEVFRSTCPNCYTPLVSASGGGVRCPKDGCGYWFCF